MALIAVLALWALSLFTAAAQARGGLTFTAQPGTSPEAQNPLADIFPSRSQPSFVTVWQGRDVDGDGAADFGNPTGHAPRAHDAFGDGGFGASRDGGLRHHEGVDYVAQAGQAVTAPISGYVSKIGYAYDGDEFRYVEITNPALGYQARVFYVDPMVVVGQAVRLGSEIGTARSLQARYAGITDHVHLELSAFGQGRLDATRMIAQRVVPLRGRG